MKIIGFRKMNYPEESKSNYSTKQDHEQHHGLDEMKPAYWDLV